MALHPSEAETVLRHTGKLFSYMQSILVLMIILDSEGSKGKQKEHLFQFQK